MAEPLLAAIQQLATLGVIAALAAEWALLDRPMGVLAFARLLRVHAAHLVLLGIVVAVGLLRAGGFPDPAAGEARDTAYAAPLLFLFVVLAIEWPTWCRTQRWRRWARAVPGLVPPRPWELRQTRRQVVLVGAAVLSAPLLALLLPRA